MKKKQKGLMSDMLDIGVGAIFAGTSAGIVQNSGLPAPIATGGSALIGAAYLKGVSKKIK